MQALRVERHVARRRGTDGAVVCLTNEPSYWRPATHGRETNAHAFRTHEDARLHGVRAWGALTGAGTRRNREEQLSLRGDYRLRWRDYSVVAGPKGTFRSLVVAVAPPALTGEADPERGAG